MSEQPRPTQCSHDGCHNEGLACWLPDTLHGPLIEPDEFFCSEHAHEHGYCWGCGQFWGGIETFDFNPQGLCDNCKDDPDVTGYESDEDDVLDYDFAEVP